MISRAERMSLLSDWASTIISTFMVSTLIVSTAIDWYQSALSIHRLSVSLLVNSFPESALWQVCNKTINKRHMQLMKIYLTGSTTMVRLKCMVLCHRLCCHPRPIALYRSKYPHLHLRNLSSMSNQNNLAPTSLSSHYIPKMLSIQDSHRS